MVALALTFAAALAAAAPSEAPETWDRLPPEIVRDVENAVVMPSGAADIDRYDRFYSAAWQDDRLVVVGSFVQRRPEQSEGSVYRLYGPQPFEIDGGGCRVVNLVYDVDGEAAPDLNCNGEPAAEPQAVARKAPRSAAQIVDIPRR
jgi:hypothetical protein